MVTHFIKLTLNEEFESPIFVNIELVSAMLPNANGTEIWLCGNRTTVKESIEDIIEKSNSQ